MKKHELMYELLNEISKKGISYDEKYVKTHFKENMDFLLTDPSSPLKENEKQVVLNYYYNNLTLQDIGNINGVSKERIRQVLYKAMKKLVSPNYSRFYLEGRKIQELKIEIENLEEKLLERKNQLEAAADYVEAVVGRKENAFMKIDELELSQRSFNCLWRYFRNQGKEPIVANIFALTESELRHIKNLGDKCAKEIIQKMAELGYKIRS